MGLQRVQVFLTQEQYRRLKGLARQRGTSLSALMRELVAQSLAAEPQPAEVQAQPAWLEASRAFGERILARRGGQMLSTDAAQWLQEIREERVHDIAPWLEARSD